MVWGSVGFVYLGASLRISFLAGLWMSGGADSQLVLEDEISKEQ